MIEHFRPGGGEGFGEISILGYAHLGDAVFELMARTWLVAQGAVTAKRLHNETVALVSAKAQASAAGLLMPALSEEEKAVFMRGRNARVNSVPRGSTHKEYHASTGIEALFGYLYLKGKADRLDILFGMIVDGENEGVI